MQKERGRQMKCWIDKIENAMIIASVSSDRG